MQDEGKEIEREAWLRLLERDGGAPPRATDARIRARARRALVPQAGRWWLPASLAASLLLAVLIVQWQYGEIGAPQLVTESDVATGAVPAADAVAAPEAADPELSVAPVPAPSLPAAPAPAAAIETRERSAPAAAAVAAGKAEPLTVTGATAGRLQPARQERAEARTPEAWYAEIQKLREEGRHEEAESELQRLEAAHPGWLDKHLAERR